MKKVIVMLAAAFVGLSAMAQAQFGAKVGFDVTHFWGKDAPHRINPNYQLGLLMEYKFNPSFGISPEVVFAAQGGQEKVSVSNNVDVTTTCHTNYINVPVMLKCYASPNFSIDFGPQVGFNVYSKATAEAKGKLEGTQLSGKETESLGDYTKTVDFGIGLGGTYNLTENAFVQVRYTLGLTKVFDSSDAKNGNAQIAFGWKF